MNSNNGLKMNLKLFQIKNNLLQKINFINGPKLNIFIMKMSKIMPNNNVKIYNLY
jgi:hypothetical protein